MKTYRDRIGRSKSNLPAPGDAVTLRRDIRQLQRPRVRDTSVRSHLCRRVSSKRRASPAPEKRACGCAGRSDVSIPAQEDGPVDPTWRWLKKNRASCILCTHARLFCRDAMLQAHYRNNRTELHGRGSVGLKPAPVCPGKNEMAGDPSLPCKIRMAPCGRIRGDQHVLHRLRCVLSHHLHRIAAYIEIVEGVGRHFPGIPAEEVYSGAHRVA